MNPCTSDADNSGTNNYFDLVCRHTPIIQKALAQNGASCISEYSRTFSLPFAEGYQQKDDFFHVVHEYLVPFYGDAIARRAVKDLNQIPAGLTANHHGVDFFAQSVQGSLLFSRILGAQNPEQSTIPVIACANIPLNNLTFPRGILLYNSAKNNVAGIPQKLPIFSDKLKNSFVSLVGPMDKDQVERAKNRVEKLVKNGEITPKYAEVVHDILQKDYHQTVALNLASYSQQSVVLNHRLWERMFTDGETGMDMIYMELEAIVSRLLEMDLPNPDSLIHKLMFIPDLAQALVSQLDGAAACWVGEKLSQRLLEDPSQPDVRKALGNCGTHFFWGVAPKNKLVPLKLEGQSTGSMKLTGKDDHNKVYSLAFDPPTIVQALKQKQLIPSLLTCYTTLSMARGIGCIGGYYQSEYLPGMQKGIINTLMSQGMQELAEKIENIPTGCYLSGMQTIMTPFGDHGLIPAGPVEIIATGGISRADLEQIGQLTVRQAHMASLLETIPDVVPYSQRPDGWAEEVSQYCYERLYDTVPRV